jgi:hypothetical protein
MLYHIKSKYFDFVPITVLLIFLSSLVYGKLIAQTTSEKSIVISKENLRQILSNNNKKHTEDILFNGFGISYADSIKSSEGITVSRSGSAEINIGKKKVIVEVTNNIVSFRKFLEINNIKFIYSDSLKIRASNIITQEEANVIAAIVVDVTPMPFKAEYNDTTRKDCHLFRLYYYKTKLRVSMENYSENLLQGYVDKFQTLIEETKIRLSKFN